MLEWTSLDKLRKKKPDTILLLITVIGVCIILGLSSIQTTYSCVTCVPGSDTDIELNNHAPIISTLDPGDVKVIDENDRTSFITIGGGVIEVKNNRIMILAESA